MKLKIIEKTKVWFTFSLILIGLSLYGVFVFGLRLGIDFTGGTLMELQFTESVESAQINDVFNSALEIDQGTLVIPSEDNHYIVRTKDIDDEKHTQILLDITNQIGEFEELRFTTIGPTVGKTMKEKPETLPIQTLYFLPHTKKISFGTGSLIFDTI